MKGLINLKINVFCSESEDELVSNPGSVMSRKPVFEKPIIKKRKRPGKQVRRLQGKLKSKVMNVHKK